MNDRVTKTGLALAALLIAGIAAAPAGHADCFPGDIDPMCDDGSGMSSGVQAGDLVIPAGGGPPVVAAAPAAPGAPVVPADGGMPVIPAAPPIG